MFGFIGFVSPPSAANPARGSTPPIHKAVFTYYTLILARLELTIVRLGSRLPNGSTSSLVLALRQEGRQK
jgi:hypothetical protein